MTFAMDPPPPKSSYAALLSTSESTSTSAMGPPPPKNPNQSEPERLEESSENPEKESELIPPNAAESSAEGSTNSTDKSDKGAPADGEMKLEQRNNDAAVPYAVPAWSGPPVHNFFLEVLKDGAIISQFDVLVTVSFQSWLLIFVFLLEFCIRVFVDPSFWG